MKNYNLGFISDRDLFNHVLDTVRGYRFTMNLKEFNKNIIDPIKLTFDSLVYNQGYRETVENEVLRQLDKTNSNLIGFFHQNIFKYFDEKWTIPTSGYDIENIENSIYVEMKNKHNTMNSSSSAKTYMRMQNSIIKNPNSKCYLVEVISKQSQDIPWVITLDGEKQNSTQSIRRISIDKFYSIVTGKNDSFKELCNVLPDVINDCVKTIKYRDKANTVFAELEELSSDLLSSLYLLSFNKYEGFNNFKL